MNVELVDIPGLKKILWIYFILGYSTAMAGLTFFPALPRFLGLPGGLILVIAGINFIFSISAFILARKKKPTVSQVQVLGYGTWIWALMTMILLYKIFYIATLAGIIFLVVQVLLAAAMGSLKNRHLQ